MAPPPAASCPAGRGERVIIKEGPRYRSAFARSGRRPRPRAWPRRHARSKASAGASVPRGGGSVIVRRYNPARQIPRREDGASDASPAPPREALPKETTMTPSSLGLLTLSLALAAPAPVTDEPPEQVTLARHTNAVLSVAFTRDHKTLASYGYDHTIVVWDVGRGRERFTLTGHAS